jgi:hypothetical protein
MTNQPNDEFVQQFMELWNEPDNENRRKTVDALFAPHGSNYTATLEATGPVEIDARVKRSFDKWVAPGVHRFRLAPAAAQAHHGAVRVTWEMFKVADGEVVSTGVEYLLLDADGRILSDHQFVPA